MMTSLLRLLSVLILSANVACFSVEKLCARRCLYGRGGALCNCNIMHFAGKRSGVVDHSRPSHNLYSSGHIDTSGRDQKFGEDAMTGDPKYRLQDLSEVIGRLSQSQEDNDELDTTLFSDGNRQENASPSSDLPISPKLPQLLHEFQRLWQAREKLTKAVSERDNLVASQISNNDNQNSDNQKLETFVQNRNRDSEEIANNENLSSSSSSSSSSSTRSNDDLLRSQVAETVRELMGSHLQPDQFVGTSNQMSAGNRYYHQQKRNSKHTNIAMRSNDSPSIPDTPEVVSPGFTTRRQSKDGLTLTQLDQLLKQAFGKGSSRIPVPYIGHFDDKRTRIGHFEDRRTQKGHSNDKRTEHIGHFNDKRTEHIGHFNDKRMAS